MYYSSNIVLNALAKDGRESVFAVAEAYNISVSEVMHADNCTIKSLVWEHFVHTLFTGESLVITVFYFMFYITIVYYVVLLCMLFD